MSPNYRAYTISNLLVRCRSSSISCWYYRNTKSIYSSKTSVEIIERIHIYLLSLISNHSYHRSRNRSYQIHSSNSG
nr:MAG TPA: hypothetical protein [Caudoviricetes sp.]